MDFKISLAGVTVGIHSIYDAVYKLCRDYLAEGEESFRVEICDEDIAYEREKSVREAHIEHRIEQDFPAPYLETLAVYRQIASNMLTHNVFLMHGSAVAVNGEAFLFTAPSGTGKTTHTRLWLENIPGAFVVNGDKPLIRAEDSGCTVCGTPWAGKEGWNTNATVPLRAICILERGEKNHISPLTFSQAFPAFFAQVYRSSNRADTMKTMELIKKLSRTVRLYRLSCNMDPDAAAVAFEGMRRS